ncbi:ABC transporter permease [Halorubrum vacuolatum]|uniref:Spermidine/putrescine transport system permease protein n=1 Tax=Halorubrum vacuolatum TaxID=63740 RepID=A0A238VMP2_HALVU|nr:ABC transporter permease [Halorubrum vacuolatum]SNR34749.1 spermidine/putrescine transport system permease protein [Halorubrum vacuolatum]
MSSSSELSGGETTAPSGFRARVLTMADNSRLKGLTSLGPIVTLLTVFYAIPVALLIVYSVFVDDPFVTAITFEHFARFLDLSAVISLQIGDLPYVRLLARSLGIAVVVTVLSLIIAYPITYYLGQHAPERWQMLLVLLVIIPFWTSYLIRTYAWIPILSRNGFINGALGALGLPTVPLLNTYWGSIIGLVYVFVPFVILPLYASMRSLDASLIEAARDLGASRSAVFREVVFPLTLPGALAGAVFVFIKCAAAYVTPALLGGTSGRMFAQVIETQFGTAFNWNFGAALSVILVAVVLGSLWIAMRLGIDVGKSRGLGGGGL